MECLVYNCKNKDHQGNGIDLTIDNEILQWICIPCWHTLKGERIEKFSQLYRNAVDAYKRSEEWKKLS